MSFSRVFAMARTMAIAMGRDKFVIPRDNPVARGFQPKHFPINCRRCKGTCLEPGTETADNCQQCAGKGVEKVSLKTLKRMALKKEA